MIALASSLSLPAPGRNPAADRCGHVTFSEQRRLFSALCEYKLGGYPSVKAGAAAPADS